jgi:hypothetical protein
MVKVILPANCGNAPKIHFIKNMNIAFANNDKDFILDCLADDFCWIAPGDWEMHSKRVVTEHINNLLGNDIIQITIKIIFTHGDKGASDGLLKLQDGHEIAFCDIYKFNSHSKNSKLIEITTYANQFKPVKTQDENLIAVCKKHKVE